MKIRIRGNSVRFRLTQTEVKTFSETGFYEEKTEFGTKTFRYAVRASQTVDALHAEFTDDSIILYVPHETCKSWWESKKVGFAHTLSLENDGSLSLLLEKDFACLDETGEDQSDNYPNPRAGS